MLNELATWWATQMRSLLPAQTTQASTTALILRYSGVDPMDPGFDVALRQRRGGRVLGRISFGPAGLPEATRLLDRVRAVAPAVLEVPAAMLLETETTLPLAAERDLGAVLSHEMDRLSPFAADAVYWAWSIAARNRQTGRLAVRLSMLPRAALQPILQPLAACGIVPAWLEVPDPHGPARRIFLSSPAHRRSAPRTRLLAACCAGLALAACALPFIRQSLALSAAEDRIAALQPRVAAAEGVRRRLAAISGDTAIIAAEAARTGNALSALATVTRSLPDDTYLTELSLHARKLTLTGRSDAAARLIALLTETQGLRDPGFTAPVMRMTGDHGEQFTLQAEFAP